jgi:hypothetical protein
MCGTQYFSEEVQDSDTYHTPLSCLDLSNSYNFSD